MENVRETNNMDPTVSYKELNEKEKNESPSAKERIPARFVLVFLLFWASFISYVLRTNLSLTIVAMVNQTAVAPDELNGTKNGSSEDGGHCPYPDGYQWNSTDDGFKDGPFVWDFKLQSYLQGGFFYGYTCTQIIGGRIAEIFGPKLIITLGYALATVFTLLTPVTATHLGPYYVIALRVLTGIAQGALYPAANIFFVRWIPLQERSRMYVYFSAGADVAVIVFMPLIGWLCDHDYTGGWVSVFYISGSLSGIFVIFWQFFVFNSPHAHPRISLNERNFILGSLPEIKVIPVPWWAIMTSFKVWTYFIALSTSSWVYYTRLTELPTYLNTVLHLPIQSNAYVNTLVTLSSIVFGISGGFLADFLINKNILTITKTRKLMEGIAQLGSSACLMLVTFSGCNKVLVIVLLTLSSGILAFDNSGVSIMVMEMTPAFSGTVYGIANTIASATGFLSPLLTGLIVTGKNLQEEWHIVFYVSVGLCVLGSSLLIFFGSAEVQPWNNSKEEVPEDLDTNDTTPIINTDETDVTPIN